MRLDREALLEAFTADAACGGPGAPGARAPCSFGTPSFGTRTFYNGKAQEDSWSAHTLAGWAQLEPNEHGRRAAPAEAGDEDALSWFGGCTRGMQVHAAHGARGPRACACGTAAPPGRPRRSCRRAANEACRAGARLARRRPREGGASPASASAPGAQSRQRRDPRVNSWQPRPQGRAGREAAAAARESALYPLRLRARASPP